MTAKKGDQWSITEPQGVSGKFIAATISPHLPYRAVNNYRFSSESARKRCSCSCSFTNAAFDSHIVEDKIFLIENSISKHLI